MIAWLRNQEFSQEVGADARQGDHPPSPCANLRERTNEKKGFSLGGRFVRTSGEHKRKVWTHQYRSAKMTEEAQVVE